MSSASATRCWSTGRTAREAGRAMTAEIVLQIFRFGFLLLLWLFIFAAFRVVRADLFGGRAGRVSSVPPRAATPARKKTRGGGSEERRGGQECRSRWSQQQ